MAKDANGVEWILMKHPSQKAGLDPVPATEAAFEEVWSKLPTPWVKVAEKEVNAAANALKEIVVESESPAPASSNVDPASQASTPAGKVG